MADSHLKKEDQLRKEFQSAWDALEPFKSTWEDKEKALLAKVNDSVSGTVTRVRVTDAALSTLSYERQARVAAQLPTGKVYPGGKMHEGKSKLANIVLHNYIIPNANSQFDMLIKQRLWGVYASVYGSMPMMYDYRVDDDYIGPDCWLIDPRMFLPQPGRNSIGECDWVMVSTIVTIAELKGYLKKKNTSWNKAALQKLIDEAEDSTPSRNDDATKDSDTSKGRYSKDLAKGQVELVTKYESGEKGHWITFAPDFGGVGLLRDIPNPHKSGKIPVIMRPCFPLMNSIYGLGDFERGMKLQKAKDAIVSLFLEGVKNRIYPPLKINLQGVTPSTIKNQAGAKWIVTDMNAVQAHTSGTQPLNEFQAAYSSLHTMLMNQFGTTDTATNSEQSSNPTFGKTPQALKMLETRENARDTWDRFMHEKAVEELYEGMINLLCVKMEKPIDFTVFEEEINQLVNDYGDDVLEVIAGQKVGRAIVTKKHLYHDKGYKYIIDANSSMKKDDAGQLEALMHMWAMAHQTPELIQSLQAQGYSYDEAEHFKRILISSGVTDWERILPEAQQEQGAMSPEEQMMQEQMMKEQAIASVPQPEVPQFQDPDIAALADQMFGQGVQNG